MFIAALVPLTTRLPVIVPPAKFSFAATSVVVAIVAVASGSEITLSVLVFGAVSVMIPLPEA